MLKRVARARKQVFFLNRRLFIVFSFLVSDHDAMRGLPTSVSSASVVIPKVEKKTVEMRCDDFLRANELLELKL